MKETILRKVTKDALVNWDYEHETMEEKIAAAEEKLSTMKNPAVGEPIENDVVYGSVESAVKGMKDILGLSNEIVQKLKEDIVTNQVVSPEVAEAIRSSVTEEKILDTLSTIHDGWVKENGNKFEARPKNYQFAPLDLLPFKEATADLLFVQPILEAAGVSINIQSLEEKFLARQKEFMQKNGINSRADLEVKVKSGSAFYPPLEGVKTNKGDKSGPSYLITDLLKEGNISESMAVQIEEKAKLEYSKQIMHDPSEAKEFAVLPNSLATEKIIEKNQNELSLSSQENNEIEQK